MHRKVLFPYLFDTMQLSEDSITPFMESIPAASGKCVEFDGYGKFEFDFREGRFQGVNAEEMNFRKRQVFPVRFCKAIAFSADSKEEKGNFPFWLMNAFPEFVKAGVRARMRAALGVVPDPTKGGNCVIARYDSVYSDAVELSPYKNGATAGMLGTNRTGKNATGSEDLPIHPFLSGSTGQATALSQYATPYRLNFAETSVIPHNYVVSGTPEASGMTLDKLQAGIRAMAERYAASPTEEIHLALTAQQFSDLTNIDKLQSIDYGYQILKELNFSRFKNIHLHLCEYVPIVNVGTAEAPKWVRACPLWVKSGVRYGMWKDPALKVVQVDQQTWDRVDVRAEFAMGACRMDPKSVLMIMCDEGLDYAA